MSQPPPAANLQTVLKALPAGVQLETCLFHTAHHVGYDAQLALPYRPAEASASVPVRVFFTDARATIAWLTRYEGLATKPLHLARVVTSGAGTAEGWYAVAFAGPPPGLVPLPARAAQLTTPERITLVADVAAAMTALHAQHMLLTGLSPDLLWLDPDTRRLRYIMLPLWVPPPRREESADPAISATLEADPVLGWLSVTPPQLAGEVLDTARQAGAFSDLRLLAMLNPFTTPDYLAGRLSVRSDVYTLGILVYWLFYRRVPFLETLFTTLQRTGSPSQRLIAAVEAVYREKLLGEFFRPSPRAPDGLRALVEQATGPAETRPETPAALVAGLRALGGAKLYVILEDDERFALPDMVVQVKRGQDAYQATTDEDGVATFADLLAGQYSIETENTADHESARLEITLVADETRQVVIVPPFKTALHGLKQLWRRFSDRR